MRGGGSAIVRFLLPMVAGIPRDADSSPANTGKALLLRPRAQLT